jgi:hypothetical protein
VRSVSPKRDIVGDRRHDLHAGDEIDEFGEIGEHHAGSAPVSYCSRNSLKRAGDVAAHQRLEQIDHAGAVGEAEHLPHVVGAHRARGMRDRLVEQRQRIAHRAFRGARDDAERFRLDLDVFLFAIFGEMRHQHVGIDAAQIEALAARQHRDRHFADFGGGEDELGVRRRLFQRLQEQRVERRRREHVDFVDDVDLVARAHRRIAHAVVDLAHVVDAGVGGGVHLQHVDVPAFHDRLAVHAEHRHVDGRPLHRAVRQFVIQRAGEDARGGGLADAAHAGEDPGLRDAPVSNAFETVRTMASWPIRSSKLEGRYLRASTR